MLAPCRQLLLRFLPSSKVANKGLGACGPGIEKMGGGQEPLRCSASTCPWQQHPANGGPGVGNNFWTGVPHVPPVPLLVSAVVAVSHPSLLGKQGTRWKRSSLRHCYQDPDVFHRNPSPGQGRRRELGCKQPEVDSEFTGIYTWGWGNGRTKLVDEFAAT